MIEITPQLLWSLVSVVLIAPLAWFLNRSIDRVNGIEIVLRKTREEILRDYVTKAEIAKDTNRLLDRFDRLERKIDNLITSRSGAD
jgi:hypothetical protein